MGAMHFADEWRYHRFITGTLSARSRINKAITEHQRGTHLTEELGEQNVSYKRLK